MATTIYKIISEKLWSEARQAGVFSGALIDVADGFIHFSTASQARETARLYFSGQSDLLLIAVDAASLGEDLVFEPSRHGDLFPHLYGPLPLAAVLWQKPLVLGSDGLHMFPEDMV
ncbi:uncharacterized protein (DUF952 family) [Agrobacterium vitis]|nr:uncharacterized protein (DUF952 family) [Agrobacterium vitis]MBE1437445.1 uncharacterized protein (DUF952 family) [Agrobacterium vitis]